MPGISDGERAIWCEQRRATGSEPTFALVKQDRIKLTQNFGWPIRFSIAQRSDNDRNEQRCLHPLAADVADYNEKRISGNREELKEIAAHFHCGLIARLDRETRYLNR